MSQKVLLKVKASFLVGRVLERQVLQTPGKDTVEPASQRPPLMIVTPIAIVGTSVEGHPWKSSHL